MAETLQERLERLVREREARGETVTPAGAAVSTVNSDSLKSKAGSGK